MSERDEQGVSRGLTQIDAAKYLGVSVPEDDVSARFVIWLVSLPLRVLCGAGMAEWR